MIRSKRGLTLIEIIVALAIMAMIGAISAGTLSSSIDVLDGMEEAEGFKGEDSFVDLPDTSTFRSQK